MSNNSSLNDILEALAVSNIPTNAAPAEPVGPIEYDEKEELLKTLRDLDDLVKTNRSVLDEAKRLVESTGDAEYFEVYSNLAKAQSEAMKNKVKILTEKEKNKVMKDTKERELDIKEKLAEHTIGNGNPSLIPTSLTQNNIIMSGSREEMYEMILKMKEHEKIDNVEEIKVEVLNDKE